MTACSLLHDGTDEPVAGGTADAAWDAQQAAAAAAGDVQAFRRLVDRHGPALQAFCRRAVGDERDAEDICQEVFVRVWRALPDYGERGQFRPWLWRVAMNACRDRMRARRRRCRWLCECAAGAADEAVADGQSPAEAAAARADLDRLSRGLALLPERLRTPLVLTVLEHLTHAECAEVLGLSVRAVETRVFRARQRLRAWWEEAGS